MAIDPGFDVQAVYRRALEIQAAEQAEQQRQLQAQEHDRLVRARLAQEEAERNRPRTWGEAAADTGLGLAQTVSNVLGAGYGLANMASAGTIDRATGVSESFDSLNRFLDSQKSTPLQARREDLQARFDEGDYLGAAGELLTTPSVLGDYAVQSLGYLVPGMAAARVAGGVTAARGLASGLSREAAGAAAQPAATRAALGAQSGMTAGYMNVDAVNAAREAGRTEEEQQLYGLGAGAVGAVLGPAISRVTGAAGMEARAAQAFSGTTLPAVAGGAVTRTATGIGVQATEEGLQESYEQVLRNWAAGNDLAEAVPQSAITGAILGGLFGGVLGATSGRQNLRNDIADAQQDIEQNLDAGGNVIQPSALSDSTQPEASAAPDPVAAEAPTPVAPVETPIVTPTQEAPLTGARAVLAARDARMAARQRIRDALAGVASQAAQRTPQPVAAQEAPAEAGADIAQTTAPSQELTGAHRVYVEKAPLAAIRRRYGDAVAAQEAQRRGPDALSLDEVAEYFGAEAMYQQYARRPQDLPTAVLPVDPVAPAPIDLTVPKTKRDYLSSMRSAVAEATGKTPASISGKHWVELVNEAAAEGITPASPEFAAFMAVRADAKLRQAELEGKSESQLLGSIVAAFPQENIDPDVLLDAQIAWGGVTPPADADLDVLFPRTAAVASLREVAPEVANNWLNEEHRAYVEGFVAELVEGGDVAYVRDENDRIVGRTPSINPDWWKDMDPDVKPNSVRDARAILAKAQAGERLGKKQAAFLAHLLDMADAQVSENRAYREQQVADAQRERSQAEEAERIEWEARAAAAQSAPVEDAPGASRAAQEESSEGTLIRAYTDAIAAVETAEDLETLNTVVRTVRGAPTYLEFTYQQKMELESRIAEQWGRLDGYSFRLGDEGAESVSPLQIDTPAFKRWFGDSKVVDENGAPLRVYHGGFTDITQFDTTGRNAYFAATPGLANTYSMGATDAVTTPVYISMKNPMVVDYEGREWFGNKQYIDQARAEGYDGVIFLNIDDVGNYRGDDPIAEFEPTTVYVPFSAEQIKSAVGNVGTFDPSNPDIRYRQGTQAQRSGVSKQRFDSLVSATPARLGVQVQGFDTVAELSTHLGREMPANMKGVKTADNQIFIVRENHTDIKDVAFTIAHEQGHVGLEALLGPHLRSATNRMWANPAMRKRIKAKMAELNLQGDTAASRSEAAEEVLADMLASGERLNRDVWAKLRAGIKEFFAKLFGVQDYKVTNAEVDKLLNDVARVLRGDTPHGKYGPGDPDLGLWITDPAAAAATSDKFSKLNADFTATLDAAVNEVDTQKLPPLSEFAKAAATATKDNATKLLSWAKNETFRNTFRKNFMHLNQLSSFYDNLFGGRISALADLKTASEATFNKMNARKQEWKYNGESLGTTSVNDFARTWSAFGRRQPAKHKALNTLMSQATFYKVFPDRPWDQQANIDYDAAGYSQEDRQAAHARVTQLWSAIGTEGQRIYKTAQAMYEDRWNTRYKALIKELERIGKVNRVDNPEGAAMVDAKIAKYKDDIRLAMGKIKEGPYSPLQRNGRYTVVVTDADTGAVIHFSAYDTKEASQATAASLREQYSAENSGGNFNVVQSTREDFDARFAGTSVGDLETQRRQILEDVQSMLPADMDATARTQVAATVSNALTETYLSNLPDSAFMKHARTRKNVDGYDLDAFRAFADYQLRSARDIAGIEYDGQIAHALNNIDTFVKDVTLGRMRPDGTEGVYEGDTSTLRDVADAVKRQHAASLDINRAGVVKNAIQAGYLWFMTSPSQLFLNASQTHLVAFPRLAAKYGGGLARKTLHSTMGQFFRSKGSLLSEDSVLRKNPTAENQLLLDTLQQLFDNGPLDLTQAHQVSEYAGGRDAALTPYMSKVVELASVFMHRSEVFNREVTGAAAVRMELTKRGGNVPAKGTAEYDALVQEMTKLATRAIDDTHFNYAQSNKPAIMQSNTGSLVFQFQQYRFHMLALLARDIRNARLGKALLDPVRKAMGQEVVMLSPMDAAEAREARAALAWLTGVHLTFTGATGTLLAPIVFAIMDAFKDDDDLTDSRTDFINYFGKYISHGVLAGVVDTTRVSTATLIPYFGEKGYEPVDGSASTTFEYHVLNNLGPWVGLAGDAVDGVSALLNGDMYKASQELLPKPLRDAIKAPYEAVHGVKDANGIVYHEPSVLSSFTTFLGIRSAERRDISEERSRVYKANKLARSAKDRYLNRLALAYAEGDAEGINQTQEDIAQWNQRYPDLAIRSQDIRQAIRARIRTQLVADETGISSSRMPSETINAILGR